MGNLFAQNLSSEVVNNAAALAANSRFADKLIKDLQSTFAVHVTSKRKSEGCIEYVVYSLDQRDRSRWGSTFTVTPDGVEFLDDRGVHIVDGLKRIGMREEELMGDRDSKFLGYVVCGPYKGIDDEHPKLWKHSLAVAEKSDLTLKPGNCFGNNGIRIGTVLNESDPKLNDKIQLIIWCLMEHGITTHLRTSYG
jgi:hypothetical protein